MKITGNDFSKIQGRFNTRLSLSSSSVDEVIKKRVLAKTEDADHLLQMEYEKEASGLKSLFAFDNPILDIKGFTSAAEFSATFPFVPYQFIVIQKVLAEIRKHGNSGKHLSGGERSMLSGFQEAAQKIENKDENALVPFYQFYDTVHTFLESAIRRVIDRCQNAADANDGLEQQDVNVLKLLYLVRYIEDVKANIENIAILMIDDIHTDKIALRASITASLERLLTQNYISRNGDTYQYYNTELKDDTFAQLKKNVKITKERIPAATQLFTPDWIVRDMVENSLGRLWLEDHPNAELHDDWKYYLDEAEQEPGVDAQLAKLREEYTTIKPEEIKVIEIPLPKLIQNQAA